jgi:hypothetical protein
VEALAAVLAQMQEPGDSSAGGFCYLSLRVEPKDALGRRGPFLRQTQHFGKADTFGTLVASKIYEWRSLLIFDVDRHLTDFGP